MFSIRIKGFIAILCIVEIIQLALPGNTAAQDAQKLSSLNTKSQRVRQFLILEPGTERLMGRARATGRRAKISLARCTEKGLELRATTRPRRASIVQFRIRKRGAQQVIMPDRANSSPNQQPVIIYPDSGTYLISAVPVTYSGGETRLGRKADLKLIVKRDKKATPFPTITASPQPTSPPATPTATPIISPEGTPHFTTPTPSPQPTSSYPIPGLSDWQDKMTHYGRLHCNEQEITTLSTWEGSVWYYDGMRVYFQIADYTGDASWMQCARYVRSVYRGYVIQENGYVGGWRVFPEGLAEDYLRLGDDVSAASASLLAYNSPFAPSGGGSDFRLSRETAYIIHAYLSAMDVGHEKHPKLTQALEYALGHLSQWATVQSADYVQPFMMGLTFEALIRYYERFGDERIPAVIETAADWLWRNTWNESAKSFQYMLCKPHINYQDCYAGPTPDLNLLIAPAYAWLYKRTGAALHRERGDAAFLGGVQGAWLGNGKQFSQNYRWSFDYVRWRQGR